MTHHEPVPGARPWSASSGPPTLGALIGPEEWTKSALCAQTDPDLWFPEKGGSTVEAKRVCRNCTVTAECLEYALTHHEGYGVWGGLSEVERRRIGTHRVPCPDCGRLIKPHTIKIHGARTHGWAPEHGTIRGWGWHNRRHQKPCDPCREAMNAHQKTRRQAKAAS
jgi:WhiB family redox-sensing transcriptional regulator